MKTYHAKPGEVTREWLVVDATGISLGRLASRIALILRGKHRPQYTPHIDTGDFVIVVNASKVRLTGNKLQDKMYRRYSGYPGGLTEIPASKVLENHPQRLVESAVRGMLPKGPLGRKLFRKLKVYAGPAHPHQAQHPQPLAIPDAARKH